MKQHQFKGTALLQNALLLITPALIMPALQAAPRLPAKSPARVAGKNAAKQKAMMRQVVQKLNLSAAQQTKIEALWKKSQANLKALRDNKALTTEQKRARRQVIQADRMAQIRQLLSSVQRQKLDSMIAEQKKKRKKP